MDEPKFKEYDLIIDEEKFDIKIVDEYKNIIKIWELSILSLSEIFRLKLMNIYMAEYLDYKITEKSYSLIRETVERYHNGMFFDYCNKRLMNCNSFKEKFQFISRLKKRSNAIKVLVSNFGEYRSLYQLKFHGKKEFNEKEKQFMLKAIEKFDEKIEKEKTRIREMELFKCEENNEKEY